MRSRIVRRLRKSAAPFALSNLALALIVTIAYRFHLNTAIVVLLCLLVTVLLAQAEGFVSSAIVSIIAGTFLAYFLIDPKFDFPIFGFRIDDPVDVYLEALLSQSGDDAEYDVRVLDAVRKKHVKTCFPRGCCFPENRVSRL